MFILILEIFCIFVKSNPNVKNLNILNYEFSYTACGDDYWRKSAIELMNELNTYSNSSWLKPNKTKYEITGIGVMNEVSEIC